ncbi:MAG: type III-A CRISPR-associated RAMP protein Csm4, partial [Candidatus Bilamarchaeaceae archaeon]
MKIVKLYPAENSKFHFGEFGLESEDYIFHSDSLFSSLVINYIRKHGNDKLNEFVNTFPRVSSLFYGIKTESKEVLFIPSYLGFNFGNLKEDDRKIIKKVKFVSINSVKNSANIAKNINSNIIYSKDDGIENKDFQLFYSDVEQKVCIDRETGSALKGGLYNISFIRLSENVFFYFLVDSDQISEDMRSSIETIRNFGLGGKISNGFGQIKEIKIEDFSEFNNLNGNKYVNLSVV